MCIHMIVQTVKQLKSTNNIYYSSFTFSTSSKEYPYPPQLVPLKISRVEGVVSKPEDCNFQGEGWKYESNQISFVRGGCVFSWKTHPTPRANPI